MGDRCRVGGRQKLRLHVASSQIVFTLSIAEFFCPVFQVQHRLFLYGISVVILLESAAWPLWDLLARRLG